MIAGDRVPVWFPVYKYLTGEDEIVDIFERTDAHFVLVELKQVIKKTCSANVTETTLRPIRCLVRFEIFFTDKT